MKHTLLFGTLLVALAALCGCYKADFVYTDRPMTAPVSVSQSFYIVGLLGPDTPVRADRLCPAGVTMVQTKASLVDSLVGLITFAIYTPRTVDVFCTSGKAHNFYLDEHERPSNPDLMGNEGHRELVDVNTQVY